MDRFRLIFLVHTARSRCRRTTFSTIPIRRRKKKIEHHYYSICTQVTMNIVSFVTQFLGIKDRATTTRFKKKNVLQSERDRHTKTMLTKRLYTLLLFENIVIFPYCRCCWIVRGCDIHVSTAVWHSTKWVDPRNAFNHRLRHQTQQQTLLIPPPRFEQMHSSYRPTINCPSIY